MAILLDDVWEVSEGDEDVGSIDCTPYLDPGELVASLDTVVEQTTSDLTFSNQVVSTAVLRINGVDVAIGKAVQFKYSGQLNSNSPYTVRVTFTTDSTPARIKVVDQKIEVAT